MQSWHPQLVFDCVLRRYPRCCANAAVDYEGDNTTKRIERKYNPNLYKLDEDVDEDQYSYLDYVSPLAVMSSQTLTPQAHTRRAKTSTKTRTSTGSDDRPTHSKTTPKASASVTATCLPTRASPTLTKKKTSCSTLSGMTSHRCQKSSVSRPSSCRHQRVRQHRKGARSQQEAQRRPHAARRCHRRPARQVQRRPRQKAPAAQRPRHKAARASEERPRAAQRPEEGRPAAHRHRRHEETARRRPLRRRHHP